MNLELCTDCVEGALLAGRYGFKRIELCAALSEGGLTPSFGMIESCSKAGMAEVHSMIRSRGGSFTCDDSEMAIMKKDIQAASQAGAKGVVFGILKSNNEISGVNGELLELAHSFGLQATFHRAFDQVRDPFKTLDQLVEMGFDRLLTSGLKDRAIDGLELIKSMQLEYGSKIDVMAGSGVNPDNVLSFANAGIENLHFTARKQSEEVSIKGMGVNMVTDEAKIRAICDLFD